MSADREAVTNLTNERNAAEALKQALAAMPGMDEETVRDTIEGETSLHEALQSVVEQLTETELMTEGLDAKLKEFEARKKRYKDRAGYLRAAIEQAMLIGNLTSKEFPDCTLVLAKRAGVVVITDEAKVPARFWKPQDPVLDKAELGKALKAKEEIPGAILSNGSVSLTIRRS